MAYTGYAASDLRNKLATTLPAMIQKPNTAYTEYSIRHDLFNEVLFGEIAAIEKYTINRDKYAYSPMDFGAYGDGLTHPLSGKYATLAAAQVDYPHATGLGDEIDWAAIQLCLNKCQAAGMGVVFLPAGHFIINKPIEILGQNIWFKGSGFGTIIRQNANVPIIKVGNYVYPGGASSGAGSEG